MAEAAWFVAHTYSGYENKVKNELEKTIVNRNMQDRMLEVTIPMEEVMEESENGKRLVQRKMFPGYVLIHMVMDDETWYVVRNTRGVTGFVGPESKPVPLSEDELVHMGLMKVSVRVEFAVGDYVQVISDAFRGMKGTLEEVNPTKRTATIMVDMFGRKTPAEFKFEELKKC